MENGQPYLYGDKSLDETVKLLQSRVSIYMAEQYGYSSVHQRSCLHVQRKRVRGLPRTLFLYDILYFTNLQSR